MNHLPRVAVLLAVYEPNDALIAQLMSINKQIGVEISLYIGDDGSSFDIREIYKNYLPESYSYSTFERVGPGQNFMNLILRTGDEDFFAFCDQDDIWLKDKLIKHISLLVPANGIAAGTHSNSAVLHGENISLKKSRCNEHHLAQLLSENCVQGCTLVINKKARDLIRSKNTPSVIWHDWWIGLVLSSVGRLMFVPGTDTLYRIHSQNTIGLPGFRTQIRNFFFRPAGLLVKEHKLLFSTYSLEMRKNDVEDLKNWIKRWDRNFLGRIVSAATDQRRRKSLAADLLRKLVGVLKKP